MAPEEKLYNNPTALQRSEKRGSPVFSNSSASKSYLVGAPLPGKQDGAWDGFLPCGSPPGRPVLTERAAGGRRADTSAWIVETSTEPSNRLNPEKLGS